MGSVHLLIKRKKKKTELLELRAVLDEVKKGRVKFG